MCHGSLGVSQIYRRAYLATGDTGLLAGAERWLAHGLGLPRWTDGAAGFKCRIRDGYATSYDVLQGIAGIGLALVAAAGDARASAWDRCLLLS